jgi:PIN domain nuclease of toxin-antitoxin system
MGELRLLLDTHAWIWWLNDDTKLSTRARTEISNPGNEVLVSAAVAWEVATKHRLGKLPGVEPLLADMTSLMLRSGFKELPVTLRHGLHAGNWPLVHRDPFDRMLAAQSALEDAPLVTRDAVFREFDIDVVW